ncbi:MULTISPECIES: thioredoxin domain-containing protein [Virgibacillus]|nr:MULTISPECIES: thioredoxin domain-containing protein [Virgibacillus]
MMFNNKKHANRLIKEKSPYLLQHAYNPVNWYPWSEEAFAKAKEENKPIFLSIGYSTCHWCHVMAKESFEDAEVATILNETFVSIKVDREERPDIDSIYMKVCQMMTGQGGWPLSIFMSADQIPFYAGTYFPKHHKYGMPGFVNVLQELYKTYTQDPEHIADVTSKVENALRLTETEKSVNRIKRSHVNEAFDQLENRFDKVYGGFGHAPKFPMPHNVLFLLNHSYFTGNKGALKMAKQTLDAMAAGGIYDHIGFGFSRYSTDKKWLVPHFEKMLYDNALLLIAYTEAYQLTKRDAYKNICNEMIAFVSRELTHPNGGFYSAIDADSEGIEGKYYVWEEHEIDQVLGKEDGKLFKAAYQITPEGNFSGKNIPNLINQDLKQVAASAGVSLESLTEKLVLSREKLLEAREKRTYPHVDDKILTAWNGLMIAALAKAGKVFQNSNYTEMAQKAIQFIEDHLYQDGRLMVRYRKGESKHVGYLDDYAFLLWGYIELYESTFHLPYLEKAKQLLDQMIELFWDNEHGGFYFSGNDNETLIAKDKEVYDDALPSGNSVAAVMLVRMGYLTGETRYLDYVEEMFYTFHDDIKTQASGSPFFLLSLQRMEFPSKQVVVIGPNSDLKKQAFLQQLQQIFLPNITILSFSEDDSLEKLAPFASAYRLIDGETTIYVCENFACKQPTTSTAEAFRYIQE